MQNQKSIVAQATRRPDGSLNIAGVAWTDGTPLRSVEVKVDDGPWQAAKIERAQSRDSKYAWSFWNYAWKQPAPGEHTLVSRATDIAGVVQPAAADPVIKLKQTYYEANQQFPRKIKI